MATVTRVITALQCTVNPDEAAHDEPPHLDLHCLLKSLLISLYDIAWRKHFENFICKFCRLLFFAF